MKSQTAIQTAVALLIIVQSFAFAETRTIGGDETKYQRTKNVEADKLFIQGADELYGHGNVENAIGLFTKALELDPRFVEVLDNLGTCYRRTGEYDKAIECYKRSIAIFPKGAFAHQNMAVAYGLQKKYELAISEYNIVKEIDPSDPEPFYGISKVSINRGDYSTAISNAKVAISLYQEAKSPLLGDAEQLLATAYEGCGDDANAKIWSEKAEQHKTPIDSEMKKLLPQ
jgi:tetratricopeptide (TPR) repeat protein